MEMRPEAPCSQLAAPVTRIGAGCRNGNQAPVHQTQPRTESSGFGKGDPVGYAVARIERSTPVTGQLADACRR
jgi:hypothetical protein